MLEFDELKVACTRAFAKDCVSELMPWLKKMKLSASSSTGRGDDKLLTLGMRAITTSVILFKDDVSNCSCIVQSCTDSKFENLKMFESTVWCIL